MRPAEPDLLGARSPGASGPVPCSPAPWQRAPHPMLRDLQPRLFILFSSVFRLVRRLNPRKKAVYRVFSPSQHRVFSLLHIRRIKSNIIFSILRFPKLSPGFPDASEKFGSVQTPSSGRPAVRTQQGHCQQPQPTLSLMENLRSG